MGSRYITLTMTREALLENEACSDCLALFDSLAINGSITIEWTPLAALWLARDYPGFAGWLKECGLTPPAYLRGAYLGGADLRGANSRGTDLTGADLSEANLRGANLRNANICGANLSGVNLTGADPSGADLSGAYLADADMHMANLQNTDLRGLIGYTNPQ